ncbi:hypothetical protein ABW20_dc0102714 [Dactylellina cionopaga]|nr:hypothetical protein ABW20_dc0102714 [Dactylellina cionopaga]
MESSTSPTRGISPPRPVIENIDGADFRKNFTRLQIEAAELSFKTGPKQAFQNEAAQGKPSPHENALRQTSKIENSHSGSGVLTDSKGRETGPRKPETQDSEGTQDRRRLPVNRKPIGGGSILSQGQGLQQETGHLSQNSTNPENSAFGTATRPENESMERKSKATREELNKETPPRIDPIHAGFVKYLSDKASYEIQQSRPEAAQPYMERLASIAGTELVIAELKHQQYDAIMRDGVEKLLSKYDLEGALRCVEMLEPYEANPYRIILTDAILQCYLKIANAELLEGRYADVFARITEIQEKQKIWGGELTRDVKVFKKEVLSELIGLAAGRIESSGSYPKSLENTSHPYPYLKLLYDHNFKWEGNTACVSLAHGNLEQARDELRREQPSAAKFWYHMAVADKMFVGIMSGSFDENILKLSSAENTSESYDAQKRIVWRDYTPVDQITDDILALSSTVLSLVKHFYEKQLGAALEKHDWVEAWKIIGSLKIFWENPELFPLTPEVKAQGSIVELHVATRLRRWDKILEDGKVRFVLQDESLVGPDPLSTYYLTLAEIAYFKTRDLNLALTYCQKAIGGNASTSKSDAFYLLARIYTRNEMPLDAEYYYSLSTGEKEYDEWRIYGFPGAELRKTGVRISRGELDVSKEQLKSIIDYIYQYRPANEHGFGNGIEIDEGLAVVQGLFAGKIGQIQKP